MKKIKINASILIIGNEILSGRTQDLNVSFVTNWLNLNCGIKVEEVRIIPDIEKKIVFNVLDLSKKFNYVFTTGGIGPTHDDITATSISKALKVKYVYHKKAYEILEKYYGVKKFNIGRKKMAKMPFGSSLILNPSSAAPGFKIKNILCLPGVPSILKSMMPNLKKYLIKGPLTYSKTIGLITYESNIANTLDKLQKKYISNVEVGSYPFFRLGKVGVSIVLRSINKSAIKKCEIELLNNIKKKKLRYIKFNMKIFDCFMYYDEDLILDLRLNYLNNYVDKFIIVESTYTHSGQNRKLLFDKIKFSKFKDKINYVVLDKPPVDLFTFNNSDSEHEKNSKFILNAVKRENLQRNTILEGLNLASPNDLIIISDIDEIPNLEDNNIKIIKNKIIFFKQKYFHYKFNLKLEKYIWHGSKACKKKNLISPQWLRNIKSKAYSFWRIDTLFSKKKYQDIKFIERGGWHFSNLKKPADIEKKMKTYLHHREYDLNPLGVNKIEQIIANKKAIYNLNADQRENKYDSSQNLIEADINEMPSYVVSNLEKYKDWIV